MEYLKIKCHRCGNSFHVYNGMINSKSEVPHCPHCLTKMNQKQWIRLIDAFMVFSEVNKNFRKYHEDRGEPLFQAELCTEKVFVKLEDIYLD